MMPSVPSAPMKKVTQVVAGIVLAQAAQAVPQFAGRGHHFQPQAQFARVAVAQHRGAAGIGAEVAADGAAAFRRQAQREQAAVLARHFLQVLQHHAGLDRDGVVERIDLAHALEPLQRDHHHRPFAGRGRVAPPHRPVLPPWGTMATRCAWQACTPWPLPRRCPGAARRAPRRCSAGASRSGRAPGRRQWSARAAARWRRGTGRGRVGAEGGGHGICRVGDGPGSQRPRALARARCLNGRR